MGNNYSSIGFSKDNFYAEKEKNGNVNFGYSLDLFGSPSNKKGIYVEHTIFGKDDGTKAFGFFSEKEERKEKDSGFYSSYGKCVEKRNNSNDEACLIY